MNELRQRLALGWVIQSTRACFKLARLGVWVGGAVTIRALDLDKWARLRFEYFVSRDLEPEDYEGEGSERRMDA